MAHQTRLRVTWGDTDAGGLIYFPRFFHFVVVGLNDYFSTVPGEDDPEGAGHLMEHLRREGYVLPAVDASASFESPLRAGEGIVVETAVAGGETSLTAEFSVTRTDDGRRAASGEVTFVLVDGDFRPAPLPDSVHACIDERGDAPPR